MQQLGGHSAQDEMQNSQISIVSLLWLGLSGFISAQSIVVSSQSRMTRSRRRRFWLTCAAAHTYRTIIANTSFDSGPRILDDQSQLCKRKIFRFIILTVTPSPPPPPTVSPNLSECPFLSLRYLVAFLITYSLIN